MTNPTTPFSWQMPTATDLVTDLPADFETFGQAVATSMADLLGGTTGQILSKASNTDMDFTWVTNDVGDITAVTAGTGISGGGTSGAVTITNDMATTITASGDIVVGTGSGTYDNLPIGTTGQVLTADTTVSPYKVKWASSSAPSYTWTSYTPTWTGLTTGNGSLNSCDYLQIGKIVFYRGVFQFGSTTSVTSSAFAPSLPVAMSMENRENVGQLRLHDNGTNTYAGFASVWSNALESNAVRVSGSYTDAPQISASVPFTWTTNDQYIWFLTYKAA